MFEMKIRVAARVAFGDQLSGWVRARIRAHAGSDGTILKALGKGPDVYFASKYPALEWNCQR